MFWGDWCGICRTQYPYERLLLELYKNWPFAIVGVNSDASREIARQSALTNKLAYRSWWDGGAQEPTKGPIASAWNVDGWPTVYVLDGRGIIRYVDIGHEDLLKGVQQLLSEQTRAAKPKPSSSK
jgi:thiol-disulfide isomerase/thioredoxin